MRYSGESGKQERQDQGQREVAEDVLIDCEVMDMVLIVLRQAFRALGQQEKHLEPFLTQEQLQQIALGPLCTQHL